MSAKVPIGLVLRRGWRRRCPRCGVGPLFRKWIEANDRCSHCGVLLQRNYGDIWFWLLIMDRVPIFAGVVLLYFGFRSTNWFGGVGFFLFLFIPLFGTMRQRQGVAIAMDYLARIYMPDPSDEIHDGRVVILAADEGAGAPSS